MPHFSIRPALRDDAGAVFHIHRRAILGQARDSYSKEDLESWAHGIAEEFYREQIEAADHFEVALNGDGEVIGFAATRKDEIWLLYVDPGWARQGVGRALLARAEGYLFRTDHDNIWVQSSLNAEPFFAAHGYEKQETIDAPTRGGATLKALRMTKTLA
jgi:putative acetyltransferase